MRYLLVLVLLPFSLLAAVAQIVGLKGEATGQIGTQAPLPLALHAHIDEGTRIVTASNGRVRLRFTDGTLITIGSDSSFAVEAFRDDPADADASFSLERGVFRAITGQIGKIAPERFRLRTHNAVIGIRGTDFAGSFRDGILGVLYLGLGNGVVVTNAQGSAQLNHPGDGVFLAFEHRPFRERWDETHIDDLLLQLAMEGENTARQNPADGFALGGSLRYFYNHADTDPAIKAHHDAVFLLDAATPERQGLRANASFYYRNNFHDTDADTGDTAVLANANLQYRNRHVTARVGRQEIHAPLFALAPVRPAFEVSNFSSWDARNSVYDWRWEMPGNIEAAYLKLSPLSRVRLHGAYIRSFRATRANTFDAVADVIRKNGITNDANRTDMFLYGAQAIISDDLRLEYWGSYLSDLYMKQYAELIYRHSLGDGAVLAQAQYLAFNGTGSVEQTIDLALSGLRFGGEYGGGSMAVSYTKTAKADGGALACIVTPFDDAVAYTNTFAYRTAAMHNGCGGPYGSDTEGVLLYAGYDFNRIGLQGLEGFVNYGIFTRGEHPEDAIALDIDLTYILPLHQNLSFNVKYAQIAHADFVDTDLHFVRVMAVYGF